jgi:hypothetical protein
MRSLDSILDLLERYHQRATYAAVAALLGTSPRSVMGGRPKNPKHSWIVSKKNGLPTDYSNSAIDPHLQERDRILDTVHDLSSWLDNPH